MNGNRTSEVLEEIWKSLFEWTGACLILVGLPKGLITASALGDIQLGIQDGVLTMLLAAAFSAPVYASMKYRKPGKGGIYLVYLLVGWIAGINATFLIGRETGIIMYATMTAVWAVLAAVVVCAIVTFWHVIFAKTISDAWNG